MGLDSDEGIELHGREEMKPTGWIQLWRVLGTLVDIDGLHGEDLRVTFPPETDGGETYSIWVAGTAPCSRTKGGNIAAPPPPPPPPPPTPPPPPRSVAHMKGALSTA